MKLLIREACREDVKQMMELVKELARFEKQPEQVINTEEKMLQEGFGTNPSFRAIVAETEGRICGMSVFYYSYSTWKGKSIYIDDIIVNEKFRGQGIGTALLKKTISVAKEENAGKVHWQVLDWNEQAIRFYNKFSASYDKGWINCSITDLNNY